MPFLLSNFFPGHKIQNCSAQFLAVCWIVHVEFKVHRLRDGFSVSNALLLSQSLPAFIGHNLDKIGAYLFHCKIHPYMTAVVGVTDASGKIPDVTSAMLPF